jgi:hypothetical protein
MLNQVTFYGGLSRRRWRIARRLESLYQKCELATEMCRQASIPVPRSQNGRMIQAVFGSETHTATGRGRVDTPAERQRYATGRIVQDFFECDSNGANDLDDATLPQNGTGSVSVTGPCYWQRTEDGGSNRCPAAKCDRCNQCGEHLIDRAVEAEFEFLLSGQGLIAGCRVADNSRPIAFGDKRTYLPGSPILSRSNSRSPKAASIIALIGSINA